MASYAALVSLVQTLEQLLDSDHHNHLHYPNPQIESLHHKLSSLQSTLQQIFPAPKRIRGRVNDLETQIRDVSYKAQDTIDFFLSRQTLESEPSPIDFLQDLQETIASIDPITEAAEEIADSIGDSEEDLQTGDSFSENAPPTKSLFSGNHRIVGRDRDIALLRNRILRRRSDLEVTPITGMAGIGKTALARSIYEDDLMIDHFDIRAWVTVSQESHVRDVCLKLLSSMGTEFFRSTKKQLDEASQMSVEDLGEHLHKHLKGRRYLIVMDDVWEKCVWGQVSQLLPDDGNGSRILLTTRLAEVAKFVASHFYGHEMSLLDEEDSWKLLCQNAFGQEPCPPYLEKIGREIAKNCGGLPLSLTVVGGLLSRREKTQHSWNKVAEDTRNLSGESEEYGYKEILYLSYDHLPVRLKGCFLYMGAFPEDSEIPVSKLVRLWVAEGFLTPPSSSHQSVEQVAEHFLEDLVDRNLIVARQRTSHGHIKTCGIHNTLRDLAKNESRNQKFFYSINRYNQKHSEAGKNSQRRLSVHKNILMCLEDVYESAKSMTLSRTLLYVGQHHHYPLRNCLTFELLRVLDALAVYFTSFPTEIVKLIHLRYLSFTYNGKLPKSISKLRNLQTLIVHRHPKIIVLDISFLPVEIWNMPQLRHILLTETLLPDLSGTEILSKATGVLLANLQTLSNVNAAGLTKEVLQNVPNLKKLVAWIEEPTAVVLHLDELQQLESFKFTVLNPIPKPERDSRAKIFYPKSLRKLTLSGCGCPWDDMKVIGQLPDLEALKLREFAFQGEEWKPNVVEFRTLEFLLLESLELKYWEAGLLHFPRLERLIIRHCYELEEPSTGSGGLSMFRLIELVDCSPDAMRWAKDVAEKQRCLGFADLQVRIYSSLE